MMAWHHWHTARTWHTWHWIFRKLHCLCNMRKMEDGINALMEWQIDIGYCLDRHDSPYTTGYFVDDSF